MKFIAHRGLYEGPGGLFLPEPHVITNKNLETITITNQNMVEKENNPLQVDLAIAKGYDVEIDLRWLKPLSLGLIERAEGFYLGHNHFENHVTHDWITERLQHLWIHCKDIQSIVKLSEYFNKDYCNYFWHDNDKIALTSQGYLWTYPDESIELTPKSIVVMPETYLTADKIFQPSYWKRFENCYAVCSDYCDAISKYFT